MANRGKQLGAIRHYCLQCCLDNPNEVRLCPSTHCVLHSFRAGRRPENSEISSLRAIHEKCVDCQGNTNAARLRVKDCEDSNCALWPYRNGHRPKTENLSTEDTEADE
jgi:hypothetical protein